MFFSPLTVMIIAIKPLVQVLFMAGFFRLAPVLQKHWAQNVTPTSGECIVGCNTCKNLCLGEAITFPDIAELRALYLKEGIWSKVKKELTEKGII